MENSNLPDNSFLEQIAQQLGQVFFSYDTIGGKFNYISPAIEQLCGTTPENIFSNPEAFLSHVHEDDLEFLGHQYRKLLVTREQTQVEFRVRQTDQETKWICVSACFIQDEHEARHLIGGHAMDITEQKVFTQNIMKYNSKKNSTLEILSHDLAAPFANIQGTINILEEQVNQGDMDIQQLIGFIKQDAMRGSDMIRDFVDNEFLESSQVMLHKERVDIASRIAIMMDNYIEQEKLISKNFKLISPEKPIFMYIDMMKFMQVMNNLVSNAIKFTQDNGNITVSVEDKEDHVLVKVADNGIGIPKKMQPYLFDRFTRARRAGVRGEKSTGLGMSIIKTIVELHNGKISFESKEGTGTTFYIEIPLE
ncbi:PAS domain S-box protein [Pontibacter diazotrophicus]|uniref:histidine kinase n=1 Tax=Pontibacter diazotrophicus TaxID=1400979 RepID=A0A3D8LC44_9BACT|nr:PAS domain-containing sensor histidine kinase [Pontibacter diazotrophicus]RDV15009.1 PAS domain S-box protein [Pontibacter diazotrophicus]